jgi:hypothetical protein
MLLDMSQVEGERLEVLQLAREHDCPLDAETCASPLRAGSWMLKWAGCHVAQEAPVRWMMWRAIFDCLYGCRRHIVELDVLL